MNGIYFEYSQRDDDTVEQKSFTIQRIFSKILIYESGRYEYT